MKNAFSRMGLKCVAAFLGGGLIASSLVAGTVESVSVTLPHAVSVGSTTLPMGHYTISSLDLASGDEYFVIRPDHGSSVTVQAQKIASPDLSDKTEVVLSTEGGNWHFEKLLIQGTGASYQFVNLK